EDIINAMPSTLNIAKAGGLEIDRAADISSNILSAFKIPASELGKVADSLVATFTRTNTDMEMLGQTMKYVAPVAQSLGMSLEESLAMTGLLGNIGIQSDQAGTALRKIEQRLAAPPAGAKKALDKLGIKTKDEKGNLRNMAVIFQELFERTKEMGSADRTKYLTAISGLEASAAMSEFTSGDFYDKYVGLLSEIEEAHKRGEAAFVAGTMSDNLLGDIEQLSSGWSRFRQIVFQTNSKGLRETTQWLTKIMSNINAFTKENPEIVRNLSYVAGAVMGITAALGLAKLAWGA
ncbi:phage tail tape measure protein, partial [Wohlfahrtiimonas larvae]